jgi:hypothetical protein
MNSFAISSHVMNSFAISTKMAAIANDQNRKRT